MNKPQLMIIPCIPVDRSRLPDQIDGHPMPKPTILYRITECEVCTGKVWIGPRQDRAYKMDPVNCVKICYYCIPTRMADVPIVSFGGGEGVEGEVRF